MQASSIDQQNNEDQEYERAHTDAMFEVNDISEKVDVVEKFIRHTKKNINELTEDLVSARNNVALLKENLVLAREKVARLQNDKRTLEIGCVVADEKIVIRLVDKISDVLAKIDELADLGFELPFRIGMNLEMLIALPERAASHIAAAAYMNIAAAIRGSNVDQVMLSQLEYGAADVVCLAVARFIDCNNREAKKTGLVHAFGEYPLPNSLYSKLGNSFHQLFERDFAENPARARGYTPTDEARPDRVRIRKGPRSRQKRSGSRGKRSKSEPPSQSRCMTGTAFQ
jgi:hypothetical protein